MGRMSGVIGKLLSFTRTTSNEAKVSDVKVNVGGGENGDILTAQLTHPSGEDSVPLVDDYVTLLRIPRSGRVLVVGFTETDANQTAQAGEKRIYARDSDRLEVVELWLKNDGTATLNNENGSFVLSPDGSMKGTNPNGNFELRANGSHRTENSNGFIELLANGTVNINGTTINPTGDVLSPTSVTAPAITGSASVSSPSIVASGKDLAAHDHPIIGGSSSPGPTGPNN